MLYKITSYYTIIMSLNRVANLLSVFDSLNLFTVIINNYYSLSHQMDPCYRQSPAFPRRFRHQNHRPIPSSLDIVDNDSH